MAVPMHTSTSTARRRHHHPNSSSVLSTRKILVGLTTCLFLAYFYLLSISLHEATVSRAEGGTSRGVGAIGGGSRNSDIWKSGNGNNKNPIKPLPEEGQRQMQQQQQHHGTIKSTYNEWKAFAVDLAGKTPSTIVSILKNDDPFGVRTFEKRLQDAEGEKQRFLSLDEVQQLFPCPTNERISQPDYRDHNKAQAFANGTESYFLFFQHLRKAGGTNFCSLAEHNLPKRNVPRYSIVVVTVFGCYIVIAIRSTF
jgi:hypothetical protein